MKVTGSDCRRRRREEKEPPVREAEIIDWRSEQAEQEPQSEVIIPQNSVKFTWPSPSMSASERTCQPISYLSLAWAGI